VSREVLSILFGAGFTVAVCRSLGTLLHARLGVTFHRYETGVFEFLSGSALLSLLTFFLCVIHQGRAGAFLAIGAVSIPAALWTAHRSVRTKPFPDTDLFSKLLFALIFTAFFIVYFFNALAPEVSPDGSGYHLSNVVHFWRVNGFDWSQHNMYAYLSQGAEMLFLVAFSFGGHSAAAMVHLAFLFTLPLLIASYGFRFGFPRVGLFAGILAFASPLVGLDGSSAYNDIALVTLIFAVFYLLQLIDEGKRANLLILCGLLIGYAFATKYTAWILLPFALLSIRRWQCSLILTSAALISILPWTLRNWIWLGNPAAPFLNRWFPNPYFSYATEQAFLSGLWHYEGINHWWQIPLEVTVNGGLVSGSLGAVFLLAPLGLLALRHAHGRKLLVAAVFFSLPAILNTGTRFLLPAVPFVSLAMGIAFADTRGALPVLALFHAFTCWPSVLSLYCADAAWRLHNVPIRAALRLQPEAEFLRARIPDLELLPAIQQSTSPGDKIFSFTVRADSYFDRDLIVGYESTFGNIAQDALWTASGALAPPTSKQTQRFTEGPIRGIQVRESDSVAEVQFFDRGREVFFLPNEPNLAFDQNLATRWIPSSHEFLQVECAQPLTVDEIVFRGAAVQARLEVLGSDGKWAAPPGLPEYSTEPTPDLRKEATRQLKKMGIRFLLVNSTDYGMERIAEQSQSWGMTQLAEAHGTHFLRID